MATEVPTYHTYLKYLTLQEVWVEVKVRISIWLVLSALSYVSLGFGIFGAEAVQSWIGDSFPKWLLWVALYCVLSWFLRGEELKYRFPKLTFAQWLLSIPIAFGSGWAFIELPLWASWSLGLAFVVGASALDELVAKGRENYLLLHSQEVVAADQGGA